MQSRRTLSQFISDRSPSMVTLVLSAIVACSAPGRPGASTAGTGGQTSTSSAGGSGYGGSGASTMGSGGAVQAGGTASKGGATESGGAAGSAGARGSGGALGSGGLAGSSSTAGASGKPESGGATGTGGSGASPVGGGVGTTLPGSGGVGGGSTGTRPCDIYQAAGFPCVAAHSTVRALYAAYSGALYQVRKGGSTKDIPVGTDGYVAIAEQDSFCSGGGCTISLIYDQSPNKNHLPKTPDTLWLKNSKEANATDGKVTINGHTAYGVYINNPSANVGYRNNNCKGVAKNDEAESMYMVLDGKRYTQWCCFDYGNATTTGLADGPGTMEAIYFGTSTQFNKGGSGNGPWVEADLEYGMFACDTPNTACSTNTPVTGGPFVTAVLKGPSGNAFALKAGNAQSGALVTKWDGKRPPGGYAPKKLGGQIILGTGGDGSNNGVGTFFEGAMTQGNPPNSVDDDIQANIVAAGYGK